MKTRLFIKINDRLLCGTIIVETLVIKFLLQTARQVAQLRLMRSWGYILRCSSFALLPTTADSASTGSRNDTEMNKNHKMLNLLRETISYM